VADLNRVYSGRQVALFFDTYERTGRGLDGWLRNLYAGRYGDLPATLVATISGQLPLDSNLWADYLPVIGELPVEPFTETEARLLLSGKGITEEATVRVILTLSGRLPLWLATLAEARPGSAADVGDPAEDVVERFLRWESDPVRRGTALAAAFPRILNQDVLAATAPDGIGLFGWLRGLPFVSHRGSYREYHEVVRGAMLRLQFAEAPARWRAQHAALAKSWEQWAADIADKTKATWTSDTWTDFVREATYHLLCADPSGSLPSALESAVKAAEHSNARLRQWAELIIDASQDTGDEVLSQYGFRLQSLIKGSESELARYFAEPDAGAPEDTSPAGSQQPASSPQAAPRDTRRDGKSSLRVVPGRQVLARPPQNQIVMLGAPGSGKTTFLSALSIALNRQSLGWRLRGVDDPSVGALIRATELLASGRQFPSSTQDIERPFLRRREEHVSVGLKLVDIAGQAAHFSSVGTSQWEDLLDTLADSSGIILLYDPVREFEVGNTFDFIFGILAQLMQRASFETNASTGRLPQHVAVCITKFDEPLIYKAAPSIGLLSESAEGDLVVPHVQDEDARLFFERLGSLSASGNGDMIIRMLEDYLYPDRVRYFVTSAIGFYLEPRSGVYNTDDMRNFVLAEEGTRGVRIRGPIRPINVVEPLVWMCSALLGKPSIPHKSP
jgi:energy-coupling factor transporter ATP-binding protein EcfA2